MKGTYQGDEGGLIIVDGMETYRGDKEPYQEERKGVLCCGDGKALYRGGDWVNLLVGIEGYYLSECIEEHPLLGGYSDTS